jgi:hypothetical protein
MTISYNLTRDERMAIHSHALSLQEYDRELLDMDFRFELNDFRAKLNSMGRLDEEEERRFMTYIEFCTMCYAIHANKDGLFGSKFRERARNALIAHYTSPLLSDSQLPIISQLLHYKG